MGSGRRVVGEDRLAQRRLRDADTTAFGDGDHFGGRSARAGPDQDGDFLAGVQNFGRPLENRGVGQFGGVRVADAGLRRPVDQGWILVVRWQSCFCREGILI